MEKWSRIILEFVAKKHADNFFQRHKERCNKFDLNSEASLNGGFLISVVNYFFADFNF